MDNIEKIKEYASHVFKQEEIVKDYANVDIGNGIKSYQVGVICIIIVSFFIYLILC